MRIAQAKKRLLPVNGSSPWRDLKPYGGVIVADDRLLHLHNENERLLRVPQEVMQALLDQRMAANDEVFARIREIVCSFPIAPTTWGNPQAKVISLTNASGSTWTVPTDWNSSNN